ncbi:MAG: hypothetical protein ABJM06_09845 [Gilvibacter sp.]
MKKLIIKEPKSLLIFLILLCFYACKEQASEGNSTDETEKEAGVEDKSLNSASQIGEVYDISKLAKTWTRLTVDGDKKYINEPCAGWDHGSFKIVKKDSGYHLTEGDGGGAEQHIIKAANMVNNDLILTLVAQWDLDKEFEYTLKNYTEDKEIIIWETYNGKQDQFVNEVGIDAIEIVQQDPQECGIYTAQETADFRNLFLPMDINPDALNKIHLIEGNKIPELYLNKFPYFFEMMRESDIYALYRFDYNDRMNGLIVRASDEDKGFPTIKLLFEYKNGNDEEVDGHDISNYDLDLSIVATRGVHESNYIADINKDGQLDVVWRDVKFKGYDSAGNEDFDTITRVILANNLKFAYDKSSKVNPALFTAAADFIDTDPIFTRNDLKLYKDALLINNDLVYSSYRDSIRTKLVDQTAECPAFRKTEYLPLSLVGDYYNYELFESSQGGCGVPGFIHTVEAINLRTREEFTILDIIEENSLVAALKNDSFVVKNSDAEALSNASSFGDIVENLRNFSLNENSFAILKYDKQANKVHLRLLEAPQNTPSENHLQLGIVVTPKNGFKKELLKANNFYLKRFKSSYN